jgi:hypothetical protein
MELVAKQKKCDWQNTEHFLQKTNKKTIEMQTKKILNVLKMQTKSTVVYYDKFKKIC